MGAATPPPALSLTNGVPGRLPGPPCQADADSLSWHSCPEPQSHPSFCTVSLDARRLCSKRQRDQGQERMGASPAHGPRGGCRPRIGPRQRERQLSQMQANSGCSPALEYSLLGPGTTCPRPAQSSSPGAPSHRGRWHSQPGPQAQPAWSTAQTSKATLSSL